RGSGRIAVTVSLHTRHRLARSWRRRYMGENAKAGQKPLRGRRGSAGVASHTRAPVRSISDGEDLDRLAREYLGVCAAGLRRLGADPGRKAAAALRGLPSTARYSARLLDD